MGAPRRPPTVAKSVTEDIAGRYVIQSTDLDKMVMSHDRALFGYTDHESLRVVPGLIQRMDEQHTTMAEQTKDIREIKEAILSVPEVVATTKAIKRYGAIGTGLVIAILLSLVFHEYNIIPALLNAAH